MSEPEGLLERLSNWIWQDYFWLPAGVSFRDLENKDGFVYAKPRDLLYVPLFAIAIYAIRLLFEKFIALPIARKFSLPDGSERKLPQTSQHLQDFFRYKSRNPTQAEIDGLSKQLDWSTLKVRRWFRRKRNMGRPSLETKFCEASWRFIFYTGAFTFGMVTLWQTPWFWDHIQCWVGYPRQNLETSTYVYYMLEASFYVSLLLSIMRDVKRKDFKEQLIHHVATLGLIAFSYVANYVRAGTLVMAVHDISDIFLEFAKCLIYIKWNNLADLFFIGFAVIFLVSRLVIFPFWIIHTTLVKSKWLITPCPPYYFFNALLLILQCLHIFWSYLILRMAFLMILKGQVRVEKDDRSDVEENSTDEEPISKEHSNGVTNGPNNHTKLPNNEKTMK